MPGMWIEAYSPHWQTNVTRVADRVFGAGYFAKPAELAQEPQTSFLVSGTGDDTLTGFVFGSLLPAGGLRDFLDNRVGEVPEDLVQADGDGVLGAIQAVAVLPEFRQQGIAGKLLQAVHDDLVGQGADKLIATFKKGPAEPRVDRLMERLGFERWVTLPSYWKERCDEGSFACVHRTGRCLCQAVFYRKAVY